MSLVLVALPTALKLLASQKLLEQVDSLGLFVDEQAELAQKMKEQERL